MKKMNRFACKIVALLTMYFGLNFGLFGQTKVDCNSIKDLKVDVELENVPGKGTSIVQLKFDDRSLGSYAIWMNAPDNEQKVYKNGENKFENLKFGYYEFVIVDRNGCSKKIEVKVK